MPDPSTASRFPDMGFIPVPYHHTMLEDRNRMDALERAIAAKVKPGNVVLDVGAGTGILSYFAAKQARKVYSVEADPAVAKVGKRLIELNGLAGKVEYTHGLAQDHLPPEPVDVIICEMMHVAMAVEQQIPVMNALLEGLQRRFPGHPLTMIPEEAVNYCQLVQADWNRAGYEAPFVRLGSPYGSDPTVTALSQITKYSNHLFNRVNPTHIEGGCTIAVDALGTVNAIRILTQRSSTSMRRSPRRSVPTPGSCTTWCCRCSSTGQSSREPSSKPGSTTKPAAAWTKSASRSASSSRPMAYGLWPMAYGLWPMAYGLWPIAYPPSSSAGLPSDPGSAGQPARLVS